MAEADRNKATLSIVVYLALTFALSSIFYVLVIHRTGLGHGVGHLALGLMWCPGISGLLTRFIFQRNFRGHGFVWGKTKYQFASYWIPLVYASAVYLPVWFAGYFNSTSPIFTGFALRFPRIPHAAALPLFFSNLSPPWEFCRRVSQRSAKSWAGAAFLCRSLRRSRRSRASRL